MVNRRMKPAQTVQLVRRAARRQGLTVAEVTGRGKGSHQMYRLVDPDDAVVGQFTVPQHPRELSWTVLRSIEDGLAPLFGEKWMEKER